MELKPTKRESTSNSCRSKVGFCHRFTTFYILVTPSARRTAWDCKDDARFRSCSGAWRLRSARAAHVNVEANPVSAHSSMMLHAHPTRLPNEALALLQLEASIAELPQPRRHCHQLIGGFQLEIWRHLEKPRVVTEL